MKKLFIATGFFLLFVLTPAFVGADITGSTGPGITGSTPSCKPDGSGCSVQNPLKVTNICSLLKEGFKALVAVVTPVAVLFIMWSGFRFVFAQGKPKELQAARRNFYYTIIGLAVFLGAWLFAEIIAGTINAIGGAAILSCS